MRDEPSTMKLLNPIFWLGLLVKSMVALAVTLLDK